jgi:recombination protein RecA
MAKAKKKVGVPEIGDLQKRYNLISASDELSLEENYLRLPTRLLWLNARIGGGFVYGRIHELFGFESTGKSLLAMDVCFAAQQCGGVVGWIDAEYAFDKRWAMKNGLSMENLYVYEENSIDKISDWIRDFSIYWRSKLTKNEPIVIVLDSIAATEVSDFMGQDMEDAKAKMGNRAKKIDEFYRSRNKILSKAGIIVIMVNQVRNKLNAGMFESNETTPGGNATKFYSSIRISLTHGKQIKGHSSGGKWKEETTGAKAQKVGKFIHVGFPKNKTFSPANNITTAVYFRPDKTGYVGYDRYLGFDDELEAEGVIKKKGSRYYLKGEMVANGQEAFIQSLATDPKLRKSLLRRSSVKTISKFKDELAELSTNRYPIEDVID